MAEEEKTEQLNNIVTIEDAGPCKKKVSVEIPEKRAMRFELTTFTLAT